MKTPSMASMTFSSSVNYISSCKKDAEDLYRLLNKLGYTIGRSIKYLRCMKNNGLQTSILLTSP